MSRPGMCPVIAISVMTIMPITLACAARKQLPAEEITLVPVDAPEFALDHQFTPVEAAAVSATRLNPRMCSIEEIKQDFWKHHRVFQVSYHTEPHIFPYVAVDEDGRGYVLTADALGGETEASVKRFNEIGARERVEITKFDAEEYLQWFLRVYYTQEGVYVPSEPLVNLILSLRLFEPESDRLATILEQARQPRVVEPTLSDDEFTSWTCSWLYWCGLVDRHELRVNAHGEVHIDTKRFGRQPSRQ